ncbi:MAG: antitoxin [Gammaproteobacteria bacterium]|nr:antitoxin [Gammaproteobacteria bacterium]
MSKKHHDIENDEKEILKDFDADEFVSTDNVNEELKLAKQAANNFMKRDSRINIRISGADLNMVRRMAVQEGLPYQTLLASVIHKFVTGRLVNKGSDSQSGK